MLEEFYNLKVFQVLKDEKVYQSTLDKRIVRLNNWRTKVTAKELKRGIDACINLTKEADQAAKKLLKTRKDFVNAYPFFENLADVLDSVIEMQEDGLRKSGSFKEWSKYKEMQDAVKIKRESQAKAREIVLEALVPLQLSNADKKC